MQVLPAALQPLVAYRQFVLYRLAPSRKKPGKMDKLPLNPTTLRLGAHNDPNHWLDADAALALAGGLGDAYGVGFSFTANDPFWFLDIDGCATAGGWSQLAKDLRAQLPGAAMEVSSSGTGLHLIGTGRAPIHACRDIARNIEFYTADRFVALTGTAARGSAAWEAPATTLEAIVNTYFAPDKPSVNGHDAEWWSETPVDAWRGPALDSELLRRAMASRSLASAFGDASRAAFADLWTANVEALQLAYPDADSDTGYNASSADAALAQHLAFWTGNHAERIQSLMWQSALVRDKWTEREDYYLPRTIRQACGKQTSWLQDKPIQADINAFEAQAVATLREAPKDAEHEMPEPALVTGETFLGLEGQLDLFKGCVYVAEHHRVMIPGGRLLKPDQFRAVKGGYNFIMDSANGRVVRNAYEAFTESQLVRFPRVEGIAFKPDRPAGCIVLESGRRRVNVYTPIYVERVEGDVQPFLNHLGKILPDEGDRMQLLAYMAACVQYQGHKFQWAPLVQGAQGNGKSLLALCVAKAIGARYVHFPLAKDIDNNFNAWLWGNIFYVVEEICIDDKRKDALETLKPMISTAEGGIQITRKGLDQTSEDICGNFWFNSNYRNSVHIKRGDRRLAIYFTAQQDVDDLARDGLTHSYFERLIDWFKHDKGYAKVAEFLHTWPIPSDLDPRFQTRAPRTSTTHEAIAAGMGRVEQDILECMAQEMPGFCGGWVSSMALAKRLDALRVPMASNKIREMMREIGFDYHPGLTDGRVNNVVLPDGGKPRLYVRIGGPVAQLEGAAEIARAYQEAQAIDGTVNKG
jgi:hypothetical protein